MKKTRNWPLIYFLISFSTCAILFIPDWEYAVQGKASSSIGQIAAGIGFPLLGIAIFGRSRKLSKQAKSKRYIKLNSLAIVVIIGWLAFSAFALFVGLAIAPAFNKGFDNLSF